MIEPLPPHCHCIYAPYYRKVKGKQKDFKKAANETMSKFSDYEKKEILGSWDKLRDFQNGADIEEIFNRIRPKYPIRRYVDIIPKNFKENELLEIENVILQRILAIEDVKKEFYKLWMSEKSFKRHIDKRLKQGHINNVDDYILKTLDCIIKGDEYILAIHKKSWNNLCYNKKDNWAVIFNENGEIMTSYKIELNEKSFEELHKEVGGEIRKGEINEKIRKAFKKLRDRYKKLGE